MLAFWSLQQLPLQLLLLTSVICSETLTSQTPLSEASDILRSLAPTSTGAGASSPNGLIHYATQLLSQHFLSRPATSRRDSSSESRPLQHAIHLLRQEADQRNADAIYMLAEMNFYGNYSLPRNFTEAFNRYLQLASLNGNASAQHMVGFMYATGIGGVVKQDQAKALLYYTFAAEGGDIRAEMAVGYRHHSGIAAPRNCDEAVHYYRRVADRAITWLRTGPPGNHMIVKDSYRLADETGGVYGEGASVSSSGINNKNYGVGPQSDQHASFEDVLEYLDLMSRKGDLKATFSLAKLYYDGSKGMKRDLKLARQYFLEVARTAWPKKGRHRQDISATAEKLASKASGFLGRMFLRGEGVKQDFELAEIWFKRGISNGDALSQYSMGIMYLDGLGVPRDAYKAGEYFSAAADQDLAPAQVRLGALFLDQGDKEVAVRYFDLAARLGHIEAYYYLAEMTYQGIGRDQNCHAAAAYYKIVAEKAENILASFKEANEAYNTGDYETALIDYLLAAEQGFESAQANVAYILDQSLPRFHLPMIGSGPLSPKVSQIATEPSLALLSWTRSAKQNNIDSLLKMGDYYLAGIGTEVDNDKAAQCYQAAAETLHSAQAYWNLGWMHENGISVEQDFHLAKRFYDQSLETNKEAYLPVSLALFKLRMRSAWNRWTGGGVKSIQDEPVQRKTWTEWLQAFLEADAAQYRDHDAGADGAEGGMLDDRDDWYGASPDGSIGGEYDDLQWDDGLAESVLIIAAAAVLMILVVYRRRRRDELNRAQQGPGQAPAAPHGVGHLGAGDGNVVPGRGLFPEPGEPEFAGWVAGGVGH